MARYVVNPAAVAWIEQLIDGRQYVVRSEWSDVQPDAAAENSYLEGHDWEAYGRWHLGLTEGATEGTKSRHAFIVGDFRRVHRSGLPPPVVRFEAAPTGRRCGRSTRWPPT